VSIAAAPCMLVGALYLIVSVVHAVRYALSMLASPQPVLLRAAMALHVVGSAWMGLAGLLAGGLALFVVAGVCGAVSVWGFRIQARREGEGLGMSIVVDGAAVELELRRLRGLTKDADPDSYGQGALDMLNWLYGVDPISPSNAIGLASAGGCEVVAESPGTEFDDDEPRYRTATEDEWRGYICVLPVE
jgi:hypothetical protein